MGTSLSEYIQLLELIAFFAGYPLVFILVQVLAGPIENELTFFRELKNLLPVSYALTGSLFVGLLVRNAYEAYQITHTFYVAPNLGLTIWAALSLLMWIRFFRNRPVLAFLHSLVFFFLVAKDIYLYATGDADRETLLTDMKLYADSIMINSACLLILYLVFLALRRFFDGRRTTHGT